VRSTRNESERRRRRASSTPTAVACVQREYSSRCARRPLRAAHARVVDEDDDDDDVNDDDDELELTSPKVPRSRTYTVSVQCSVQRSALWAERCTAALYSSRCTTEERAPRRGQLVLVDVDEDVDVEEDDTIDESEGGRSGRAYGCTPVHIQGARTRRIGACIRS